MFNFVYVKGTGTRDYNSLKVEWLDRPELVLLLDRIFLTVPLIFILKQVLI